MPKVVTVPKIGDVAFPDGMSDQEIAQAAGEAHDNALTAGVSKFMESDPTIQGLKTSEKLNALSSITQLLERFPRLAEAVDKGMSQVTAPAANQPSRADAGQNTPAPQTSQAPSGEQD
jgi:hypothetical protein